MAEKTHYWKHRHWRCRSKHKKFQPECLKNTLSGLGSSKLIVRRSPPRHSPPQTFTTPSVKSDVHHPRRSPPQTFTTSDVHHPRHSPPQTFTTPYSKMQHSPSPNIHQPLQSSPPKDKFINHPSIQNVPAVQTTLHPGSRGQSMQWLMIFERVMESNENACVHYCNLISHIWNKQMKEFKNMFEYCEYGECLR